MALYQVHNPGLSALLVPGYLIDRYALNTTEQDPSAVPDQPVCHECRPPCAVSAVGGGALPPLAHVNRRHGRRLAPRLDRDDEPSRHGVQLSVLSGGCCGARSHAADRVRVPSDACVGQVCVLVTACSPDFFPGCTSDLARPRFSWHSRFVGTARGPPGLRFEFVCGLVVPLAALALYGYYISGSLLPWALYSVIPDSPGFSATRVLDDAAALLV